MRDFRSLKTLTLCLMFASPAYSQELIARSIQHGDTLWGLSEQLLGSPYRWREILELNPQIKNPDLILEGTELRVPLKAPNSKSLVFDQPTETKKYPKLKPVDVKALLVRGQAELEAKKFNLAQATFAEAQAQTLSAEQRADAALGHGLATFHQQGCAPARADLAEAAKDPRHEDEAHYYEGLCLVEEKKFAEADARFSELVRKRSPRFAEESLFYRGFIADREDRWSDAESAYQDTIDFADQKRLVTISEERLRAMRARKLTSWAEQKVFFATASLGLGYDTNVVALPRSLAPSAYGLSSASSASALGLVAAGIKNPWANPWDHRVRYSYLVLHYFDSAIATANELQSHDLSTSLDTSLSPRSQGGLSLGYSSVFTGKLGLAKEYLAIPSGEVRWSRVMGPLEKPEAVLATSLRYTYAGARVAATNPDQDQNGQSFLLSTRYTLRHRAPHTYSPGLDLEYRPSRGKENTYFSGTALGRWDMPAGPEKWQMFLSQEGAFQYTKYLQSSASRGDGALKYTATLTKIWAPWFETRLQVVGTYAFSNVSTYAFNRAQVNLGASMTY